MSFPPLYTCSVCEAAVEVKTMCDTTELRFSCGHTDATVYANRKVILYGKGEVSLPTRCTRYIRLTVRQVLSALTGRSV